MDTLIVLLLAIKPTAKAKLDFNGICQQVFELHQHIITLYQTMIGKPVIHEAKVLMESLLVMEQSRLNDMMEQAGKIKPL